METNRRSFVAMVGGATASAVAGSSLELKAGYTYPPAAIPGRKSALDVLRSPTGLRVQRVETFLGRNLALVRVQTDSGVAGWGQIAPYDADITTTVLHRKVARLVLGQDPADLDLFVDRCVEENYKYPWSYVCRALAGVETALWDLLGKHYGKPVCELVGGRPRELRVYGSSMSRTIRPREEAERLVRLRDEKGFSAFKIRVGKVNGHDQDQWPGRTEAIIPTVRRAVGDAVALLADANSCYTPPRAIEVGRRLEENGYVHFEEPCPYWELEWTARVAESLRIPVAGGEQDNDLAQWRRMIGMPAVDIVQPDICYIGGFLRALRVAEMARERGLPVVPHSANLSLVTVFSLHLMAAIPNAGQWVEYSIEDDEWTKNLFAPALKVREGQIAVPDGPGWGVVPEVRWIEQAERSVTDQE
ncbi:MAG: D-galactarolactone cycloisomerase [Acidobacteriota bacterium]